MGAYRFGIEIQCNRNAAVDVSRATQERTAEETSRMRLIIEQNKEMMAAIQLEGERFDLDERIAAELFGLSTPQPKNISEKKMDEYRKKHEKGELDVPPFPAPEAQAG